MSFIFSYIQNIVVFMIFIVFINIIVPSKKYKPYISFVLGLVLISIVIMPITTVIGKSRSYSNIDFTTDLPTNDNITSKYQNTQNKLIMDTYKEEISKQVKTIINEKTQYIVTKVLVDISEDSKDYGTIGSISITAKQKSVSSDITNTNKKIEVVIGNSDTKTDVDTVETKNIKKLISDFYNLSVNHININIEK